MFGFLLSLVGWIWNGIQATYDAIVTALAAIVPILEAGVAALWSALQFVWNSVIKPIGAWLDRTWQRVVAAYQTYVQPYFDWLQRVVKFLRLLYTTFIQPILTIIDAFRSLLKLLELLHIQWAKELDDALAALENKLTKPLLLAIAAINGIVSRVESYVLTVENLFQRATMIGTVIRDNSRILNLQWSRLMGTLTDKQRAGPTGSADLATVDDHAAFLDAVVAGDAETTGIDFSGAEQFLDSLTAAS